MQAAERGIGVTTISELHVCACVVVLEPTRWNGELVGAPAPCRVSALGNRFNTGDPSGSVTAFSRLEASAVQGTVVVPVIYLSSRSS